MKKFIFAAMAALAVIASSCYEDKGSYDYHDVKIVDTIAFHWSSDSRSNLKIGDTVHLVANVVFTNPNENPNDWDYVWKLNHEIVAEGLVYDYMPTKVGKDYLQFYIENKTTGLRLYMYEHNATSVYSSAYTALTVDSPFYAGGWHVLSKKDGNVSCVDVLIRRNEYIDFINEDGEEDWWQRFYYEEYPDVNKELGTNPIRMHTFFSIWSSKAPEILVMQGTNNSESTFLDKDDFHKVLSLKEEFENNEYPDGSYVTDYFYGGSSNWAITAKGKLYAVIMGRNGGTSNITAFSHIYNFLTAPLELGENSFVKRFMTNMTPYISKHAIVYDSGQNRYYFFYTDTNSSTADQGFKTTDANIKLKVNNVTTAPAEYFPSANVLGNYEPIEWNFLNGGNMSGPHYIMAIKKHKETGELVYDYFDYRGQSKKVTMNVYEENVPMPEGFTENTPYSTDRAHKYFWFAKGKDLMFYDPATKETRKYTTLDSNITTLCVGPAGDSKQKDQIAVGLENKSIFIFNIDDTVLQIAATKGDAKEFGDDGMGNTYKYWETKSTGIPVHIQPRFKNSTSWIYSTID